jgi:spore coat protein U-like protein
MPYKVCVNGGDTPASPYRQLKHTVTPTALLSYDLKFSGTVVGDNGCQAAGATTADSAAWQSPINAMGTGMLQTFPLKADVIIPANSIPGTYQDTTVAVTIVW